MLSYYNLFRHYIKFIFIAVTIGLIIVITDVRHTDPSVEVVLRVIVTVFVPVRVLAHAVPLALDPGEIIPISSTYCRSQTLSIAKSGPNATLP